ncbi:hypothetical protein [Streptomyces sp. NPDC058953]|uniref:hypothetical protein n=1 Tax=unclassified Streptomyces TaxID=2593676 RepID=UPI0036A6379E
MTRILTHLAGIRRPVPPGRHTVAYLSSGRPTPPPVDPWSRPWTGPTQAEARAILRAREEAEQTLRLLAPPVAAARPRRRVYVAPGGVVLARRVPVLTTRPSPGWGWLR